MDKISVNKNSCIRCGICTEVCPVKIVIKKGESFPEMDIAKKKLCINCGHCEAFCPHTALELIYDFPAERVPEYQKTEFNDRQLEMYFKSRRSVRKFKQDAADKASIERVLDLVRYAPSSKNFQYVSWTVIYDSAVMKAFIDSFYEWMKELKLSNHSLQKALPIDAAFKQRENGEEIIMRGAPHCIVAVVPENSSMGQAAVYDGIIALSQFDMLLPSYGMGGFWAGFLTMGLRNNPELRMKLGIAEGHLPAYAYGFGIPKYELHTLPKRKKAEIRWR